MQSYRHRRRGRRRRARMFAHVCPCFGMAFARPRPNIHPSACIVLLKMEWLLFRSREKSQELAIETFSTNHILFYLIMLSYLCKCIKKILKHRLIKIIENFLRSSIRTLWPIQLHTGWHLLESFSVVWLEISLGKLNNWWYSNHNARFLKYLRIFLK